jgi:type IV pilus assembly protein PilA
MARIARGIGVERGFTLLELIVVVMIIGLLAAIALPVFLSHQDKGKDASAKADARNLVTAVESCRQDGVPYNRCDTEAELGSEAQGYSWGTAPGQVSIAATGNSYSVEAVSQARTGGTHNTFVLARASNGGISRTCTGTDGCDGGSW